MEDTNNSPQEPQHQPQQGHQSQSQAQVQADAIREQEQTRKSVLVFIAVLVVVLVCFGVAVWLLSPRPGQGDGSTEVRFVRAPTETESPSPLPADVLGGTPLASAAPAASPAASSLPEGASPLENLNAQPGQTQTQQLVLVVDGDSTQVSSEGNTIHVTTQASPAPTVPVESSGPAKVLGQSLEDAPAKAAPKATAASKAKPAKTAAPKAVKSTKTNAAPAATSENAAASGKQFWIQVFSSTNRDRVEQVQKDLAALGFRGRITTKNVDGKDFYRLRYGPYAKKDEAKKFLDWVKVIKGFEASYISEETSK